jgi:hypothetical protein
VFDNDGTLARGAFVALAYRLGREAATGELVIRETLAEAELSRRPRPEALLYLRRGYLTSAQLEGQPAPLLSILREHGVIDDEAMQSSLAAVAAGGGPGGRILCNRGAISERDLDAALRRQAEVRLERLCAVAGTWRFDPHAPPPSPQKSARPFALAAWARRRVESRLDSQAALALTSELADRQLVLRRDLAPAPGDGDDTDRRILEALATPRSLAEVAAQTRAPRLRLLAFLAFLRAIGALDLRGGCGHSPPPHSAKPNGAPPEPIRARYSNARKAAASVLGVDPGADRETVKRAFRALARQRHPDMHPSADGERRRALQAEFARLTSAYHALSPRGGNSG